MGLFDLFMSEEKRIAKSARKLINRDAQPEDREEAARWLANLGKPQAILSLLQRFDMKLEHQLKDAGEKELISHLVMGLGGDAEEPLRVWLRQCKQPAVPLRLLGELCGEDAAIGMACEILDIERARDDFKPAKKKTVLIWLGDRRDPRCTTAAQLFLDDFDEGVRFAAVQTLLCQRGEEARAPLWELLADPEEDSNRLRVEILSGFVQRGWRAAGELPVEVVIPSGFAIRDGAVVRT